MRATWKRRRLGDVAGVVATSKSLSDAARKLGVNVSSVSRWIKSGKVPAPTKLRVRQPTSNDEALTEPAPDVPWATGIRENYILSTTERKLVDMAEAAEILSRDLSARPETRLQAMNRFQSLVKQLNLEQEGSDGEVAPKDNVRKWPRPVA